MVRARLQWMPENAETAFGEIFAGQSRFKSLDSTPTQGRLFGGTFGGVELSTGTRRVQHRLNIDTSLDLANTIDHPFHVLVGTLCSL